MNHAAFNPEQALFALFTSPPSSAPLSHAPIYVSADSTRILHLLLLSSRAWHLSAGV